MYSPVLNRLQGRYGPHGYLTHLSASDGDRAALRRFPAAVDFLCPPVFFSSSLSFFFPFCFLVDAVAFFTGFLLSDQTVR